MTARAGYSGTSLPRKLGIHEGHTVLLTGRAASMELGPLPSGVIVHHRRRRPRYDVVLALCPDAGTLRAGLPRWKPLIAPAGSLWLGWLKRSANAGSDLTEGVVRSLGLNGGLVDVKVCAVDEVWSALKFVYRLSDRAMVSNTQA